MNRKALIPNILYKWLLAGLLLWSLLLTACGADGNGPLLSNVSTDAGQLDLRAGVSQFDALNIDYRIGQEARVSVDLQGQDGQIYSLRQNEARPPGSYNLRINGTIEVQENGLSQTRLLANGDYRYIVRAARSNETVEAGGRFKIANSPSEPPPQLEGLNVDPAVITPNFDAVEDVALIGWRTTRPATVTVSISGANGFNKIVKSVKNQPAQEDKVVFNGLDQSGDPLPDGVYTYTIEAADQVGNVSRRAGTLQIKDGGRPKATIVQAAIGPTEIIQGNLVKITVRVKNTGKVPIRSHGPESGFTYSSREVFSSIENGKYDEKAGFWRVGLDYDSNSGGGASRYPYRWGLGEVLMPGQEVEIIGYVKVEKQESKLKFFIGLIQEQIALPQDRIQPTEVKISY